MNEELREAALEYHRFPTAGKISVTPTKGLTNQRDLALAYSPGVAAACDAIVTDPDKASELTARANLVGVITNGTAVLGLGNIGPLAAKPVMEGKGCLFKKFAGVDVFDIELNEKDPDKLIDIIVALEPTLGGINLEDIKAPECFYIEQKLRERLSIPVFHDDQHGTAIISSAALINGLKVVNKDITTIKLVCSGAGAAAIACLDLMVNLGVRRENVYVCDSRGIIYIGRDVQMEENKARYAKDTEARTLDDIIEGADVFLGLSTAGVLKPEMVAKMAENPLIFALANPIPEIMPEQALAIRPDAIVATGRSDYPNQVNNALCFPFIFRGALDVGAKTINEAMKMACVKAIAELAQAESSDELASVYQGQSFSFGRDYLIPKPFDPRLIVKVAPAVARAAIDSNVATRPILIDAYIEHLNDFIHRTGVSMRPLFTAAKKMPKRIIYAEGEDKRVLRATQVIVEEGLGRPILVGRPAVIGKRMEELGFKIRPGEHFEIVNIDSDQRFRESWQAYYRIMSRKGVSPNEAKARLQHDTTVIAAMLVHLGYADAMICGLMGSFPDHLAHVSNIIGRRQDANVFAAMSILMLPGRVLFVCDTHVNQEPSAPELAEITLMAAEVVRRFGIVPKAALLSHSNFGSSPSAPALRMSQARELIVKLAPDLEIDGEMHGDSALSETVRSMTNPDSTLKGAANLLIMPNLDAANISYNLLKTIGGEGVSIGPFLLGAAKAAHIMTPSATVRRLINTSVLAAVDAAEGGLDAPLPPAARVMYGL